MKLRNEFAVAAPIEQAWSLLIDLPRVARSLPGATIDDEPVDGGYRGRLRVKLGPVTTEYEGLAEVQELDEDERVARFYVRGRETHGQGTASATITGRLAAQDGGTHVVVETDLAVTGRAAQFGRGIMEDVAGRLIGEFARSLERELAGAGAASPAGGAKRVEALDLGAAVWRPLLDRAALPLGAFLLGLWLGLGARRR